jgi:hypothetical protein
MEWNGQDMQDAGKIFLSSIEGDRDVDKRTELE